MGTPPKKDKVIGSKVSEQNRELKLARSEEERCRADGCTYKRYVQPNTGYQRSLYCTVHKQHDRTHGHPTKPVPRLNRPETQELFKAGAMWTKRHAMWLSRDLNRLKTISIKGEKMLELYDPKSDSPYTYRDIRRIRPEHQLMYIITRAISKQGELALMGRIIGAYNAIENSQLTWEFTGQQDRRDMTMALNVFHGKWPTGYGAKKKKVMLYIGKVMWEVADAAIKHMDGQYKRTLVGTEFETLDMFTKRYVEYKRNPTYTTKGERRYARFPSPKRTAEGVRNMLRGSKHGRAMAKLSEIVLKDAAETTQKTM